MPGLRPSLHFATDETPVSWAVRLAEFHTRGPLRSFLGDMGVSLKDLAAGCLGTLKHLCALSGEDPLLVLNNSIEHVAKHRRRFRGEEFDADIVPHRARFCPLRLGEDEDETGPAHVLRRHRLLWRFEPIRTCLRHGVFLTERPLNVGDSEPHDHRMSVPETGASLRRLGEASIEAASTGLERYVADRFEGIRGPAWLDGQPLEAAVRGTEMLGGFIAFGPDRSWSDMSVADMHRAAEAGWEAVRGGIPGILPAIDAHFRSYSPIRPGRPDERLGLGMLGRWLTSRGREEGNPGVLHALVTARALDHLPFDPGRKLLGGMVERPRLVTVSSLALALALARGRSYGAGSLGQTLCHRGVLPAAMAPDRPVDQVARFKPAFAICDGMDRVASAGLVALRLGVSTPWIDALVKAGFLGSLQPPDGPQWRPPPYVDALDLQSLDGLIGAMPEKDRSDLSGPTMDILHRDLGWTAPSILSAMLGDQRFGMVRLRGRRSLDHVHVTTNDWRIVEPPPVPGMRADVAFRMLGLAPALPWREIEWPEDAPFCRTRDEGTGDWIAGWEMALFRKTFVLERRLASELWLPSESVVATLHASGVRPAVDPEAIGAILYRRGDLPDGLRIKRADPFEQR